MKEQYLVTGAGGFIGGHLSSRLEQEGHQVYKQRSYGPDLSVETIFDLAAYGNMAGHQGDAGRIYRANLMRVIEENEWIDEEKWLYVSTSAVMLPVQTPYSLSKKAAEEFLKTTGKKVAIARPFTITGVGEQPDHLIPKLIDSCLNGTEIPFVPDPVHDFLDVEDFVNALLVIKDKGEFKGEVYEVGSGLQVSNDMVRKIVEQVTGKKANLRYVDNMRAYDNKHWQADIRKMNSLGWDPKVTLYQSISNQVYERTGTRY